MSNFFNLFKNPHKISTPYFADLLNVKVMKDQLEITLYGDRDLVGELVFECPGLKNIHAATLDGEAVKIIIIEKRVLIAYQHKHKTEMILNLKIA